jgi:hypothetical protein
MNHSAPGSGNPPHARPDSTSGCDFHNRSIIYPWDYKFEDNFGSYRLHVLLKRGSGKPPVILSR